MLGNNIFPVANIILEVGLELLRTSIKSAEFMFIKFIKTHKVVLPKFSI